MFGLRHISVLHIRLCDCNLSVGPLILRIGAVCSEFVVCLDPTSWLEPFSLKYLFLFLYPYVMFKYLFLYSNTYFVFKCLFSLYPYLFV